VSRSRGLDALLAVRLLEANSVVSRDRLIEALWGEHPPETARNTIQVYISQLRKLLPDGARDGTAGLPARHRTGQRRPLRVPSPHRGGTDRARGRRRSGWSRHLAGGARTLARGEIVLSEEAHRRVAQWLEERGLEAVPQTLELKGFDEPQPAFRLRRG
jgi:hypothetical protein